MKSICEKAAFLSEMFGHIPADKEVRFSPDAVQGMKQLLSEINDELCACRVASERD